MKKLFLNSLFCLSVLIFFSCKQEISPSPLKFKVYKNNPVLVAGEPGSWDDLIVFLPCVIRDRETFYLFYSGMSKNGKTSIGLATSPDGYHFTRFAGNPVFTPDSNGFDAFSVAQAIVVKGDSGWVMYYNSAETAEWGPGPFIGRATAAELTGPWKRGKKPVLTHGGAGEWDNDFVIPCSILRLDNGSYYMYYSGGAQFTILGDYYTGMAFSKDGITWQKHNDVATREHPFAESDPVMMTGKPDDWDGMVVWGGPVFKVPGGFEIYYQGGTRPLENPHIRQVGNIGYATSNDGAHWAKYPGNPVYGVKNDPFVLSVPEGEATIECPSIVFQDSICFMYYDYGPSLFNIGLATAFVNLTHPRVH
ncbi:MAG: hypothetical protein M0P58_12160 [Bacteroidales bacterium]|nr:hypothetical protein [Bacteroidales bacterium]